MKVAISSSGKDLDSQIDPRFGRCAYFIICDTDNMSFEVFENESVTLGGGAGIQSAQFIASKGAKAVITGNCGPNAVQTLTAAGIQLYVGQSGTVKECIDRHKNNELAPTKDANVSDHSGMKGEYTQSQSQAGVAGIGQSSGRGMGMGMYGGRGMGRGIGMGRGMRMGGGRGMGRGMGMSGWDGSDQMTSNELPKEQELRTLKEQSKELKRLMEDIQSRIEKLE